MVQYGGFWWRFLAYFIDGIIVNIGTTIISAVLGVGVGAGLAMVENSGEVVSASAMVLALALNVVLTWLYFALLESSTMQATVGKLAIGLVVTDLEGNRISFGRATGRYFAKILSGLILMIGFIMAAFSSRKQGLHDIMAGTLVWKTRDPRLVRDEESIFA